MKQPTIGLPRPPQDLGTHTAFAPIALFVFKRPKQTRALLESLASKGIWIPVDEYESEDLPDVAECLSRMRRAGYYPLPIAAAASRLGDV